MGAGRHVFRGADARARCVSRLGNCAAQVSGVSQSRNVLLCLARIVCGGAGGAPEPPDRSCAGAAILPAVPNHSPVRMPTPSVKKAAGLCAGNRREKQRGGMSEGKEELWRLRLGEAIADKPGAAPGILFNLVLIARRWAMM
ncbi:Protein of unknown function [Gryllus bimaculatus]|nr:Protein of unknown function [Gryllus bimaculatus]